MLAVALAVPAAAESGYEAQVLAALNAARAAPVAFAEALRTYRTRFHDRIVVQPGDDEVETVEGVRPVDEAIATMARHAPLPGFRPGRTLAAAAADHAADQARSGAIGHGGADASSPGDRAERHGGGPYVAEAIMYGAADPIDVVRQLLVDDGVPDRGHRRLLLAPQYRYAGVACRTHPSFRMVCVIDLAETPDGREPGWELAAR